MSKVKIGILGCGRIAQLAHLKILTSLPKVELAAFAESDAAASLLGQRMAPKALAFTDYREVLDLPEIQAVVICLPNALHAEAATMALQKGKHVYLEKPLATNLADAGEILATWRGSGRVGMMGFNQRFHPVIRDFKKNIQSGKKGQVLSVRSVMSQAARTLPGWKKSRHTGGGVLLDLASHHIDLIHFLFEKKIVEVIAQIESRQSEEDHAALDLRLENGLLIQSLFSMNAAAPEDRFEIDTTQKRFTMDRFRSFDRQNFLRKIVWPDYEPSYQAALAYFIEAVQASRQAAPDFTDGFRGLQVIAAAEESAKTGKAVSLRETHENFTCQ